MVSDLLIYGAFALLFLILWALIYSFLPLTRRSGSHLSQLLARVTVRYARAGRLTERSRAYAAIALIVVGGALLTAWAGDAFIDLAELVHARSDNLQQFDVRAHAWAVAHRTGGATDFFVVMSLIGGPVSVGAIALVAAVLLLIKKRYRWLLYLAVTAGGGGVLNMELKRYFARARPALAEMLRQAHGYSFPSGHALGSTVVFGALGYLALRTATQWRWKAAAIALAVTLVCSVAISRVYLGAHWISDVAAGIAAGSLWVGVTTVAYETLRRVRRLRPSPVLRTPSPRTRGEGTAGEPSPRETGEGPRSGGEGRLSDR